MGIFCCYVYDKNVIVEFLDKEWRFEYNSIWICISFAGLREGGG